MAEHTLLSVYKSHPITFFPYVVGYSIVKGHHLHKYNNCFGFSDAHSWIACLIIVKLHSLSIPSPDQNDAREQSHLLVQTSSPETAMSIARAVLLLPIRSLSPPHEFSAAIREATASTTEQLRIILVSPIFSPGGFDPIARFEDLQRTLTFTYVQATAVAQNADRILMDIDVLLRTAENIDDHIDGAEMIYRIEGGQQMASASESS
jgi:hypothetical protein